MTDEQLAIIDQLAEAADRSLHYAARVSMLTGQLREAAIMEPVQGHIKARETLERVDWLKGAKRELADLLRQVEGPNPPQAPRRPHAS